MKKIPQEEPIATLSLAPGDLYFVPAGGLCVMIAQTDSRLAFASVPDIRKHTRRPPIPRTDPPPSTPVLGSKQLRRKASGAGGHPPPGLASHMDYD